MESVQMTNDRSQKNITMFICQEQLGTDKFMFYSRQIVNSIRVYELEPNPVYVSSVVSGAS